MSHATQGNTKDLERRKRQGMMVGMQTSKEILSIDPLSTTKIAALLGVLWALLGWILNGVVIAVFLTGEDLGDLPPAFAVSTFISSVLGGFIGGALSGFLGCHVYNFVAQRIGGIKVMLRE